MSHRKESGTGRRVVTAAVVSSMVPVAGHAATAARVDFVIGDVTGVDSSGKERPLRKGTVVREGDTIRTSRGRAQLRFTDGSRTALLPNTEFRVDEYRFDGQEDENSRSFFSLVKGGLRTITGAIGKLRRRAYKVTTPVATIGIRGTEYLLTLGNSGELRTGAGETTATNGAGTFSCTGFCYVADENSPIVEADDHPIFPPAPLTGPKRDERPGQTGTGADLVDVNLVQNDPNGSVSPSVDNVAGGLVNGQLYTVAVAWGDDTEGGRDSDVFVRGKDQLVDVTFDGLGMDGYSDPPVSAARQSAALVESGQASGPSGTTIGWSRWTGGTFIANGDDSDNPYDLGSCSSPCDPESIRAHHHQVVMIPPAEGEQLAPNTVYVFSLVGATTPTVVGQPATGAGDGVTGGVLTVDSATNNVFIANMSVVAGSGSHNFTQINAFGNVDPSKNYTFESTIGFANYNGSSGASASFSGGLTTGFTHAGASYELQYEDPEVTVVGTTAWQQTAQQPSEVRQE